eukprot:4106754-Pleurochrysis_carterae.AAC.1
MPIHTPLHFYTSTHSFATTEARKQPRSVGAVQTHSPSCHAFTARFHASTARSHASTARSHASTVRFHAST